MVWIQKPFISFAAAFGLTIALSERFGPLAGADSTPLLIMFAMTLLAMRRTQISWSWLGIVVALVASALHADHDTRWHPLVYEVAEERRRFEIRGVIEKPARIIDERWSARLRLEEVDGEVLSTPIRIALRGNLPAPPNGVRIETFVEAERPAPDDFVDGRHRRRGAEREGRPLRARALEEFIELEAPGLIATVYQQVFDRRLELQERLLDELGDARGGIAVALLTGEKAWVHPRVLQAYNDTGTAHVLAISGLHFGIIAALVWFAALRVVRRFPRVVVRWGTRRPAGLIVALALSAFLVFVGAPISAVRAWVVAIMLIVSLSALRAFCPFHGIAWAFVLVLLHRPWSISDLGFQLSFAATIAILIFIDRKPVWLEKPLFGEETPWRRRLRVWGLSVGISTAATALTTPVILAHTGFVSLGAFWTNLIVVPVVSMLVFPSLLTSVALDAVGVPGALALARFAMDGMLAMAHLLEVSARLPWQSLVPGVPPTLATLTLTVATALLLARPRFEAAAALSAIILACSGWISVTHRHVDTPELHMIPVGQGDSLLVRLPAGDILVDAGGVLMGRDPGRAIVAPYLRRMGISKLEAVVITHDDIDHVGGVPAIRELFVIRRVIDGGSTPVALSGPRARLSFARARTCGSDNDSSIVTILEVDGRRSAILTGDIERCAERWLTTRRVESLVAQAPHHGSNSSSSTEFLRATGARIVLASAGRHSRFGHPHPEVLRRWRGYGSRILSTAQHGLVVLRWQDSLRIHATRPLWAARVYSAIPSAPMGHETTSGTNSVGSELR